MSTTDYMGMFVYKDYHIDYIQTSEGRLKWNDHDSLFYAEYFIKDHLGNVRDVITTDPNFSNSLIQVTDYYPFGLEFQDVNTSDNLQLYNSKELQRDAKLDWYDYGARFYDPQLGRWHSVDPMAEKHFDYTPYAYVFNNPISLIDPMGLDTVAANTQQPIKKDDVVVMEDGGEYTMNADETEIKPEHTQKMQTDERDGEVESAAGIVLVAAIEPTFFGEILAGAYISYLVLTYGPGITNDIFDSFAKGSTKNERKINPKAQQSAEGKVKELEFKLKNAKSNSEKNDIKRQIRHWREKANQKSEPHGRGSGRH